MIKKLELEIFGSGNFENEFEHPRSQIHLVETRHICEFIIINKWSLLQASLIIPEISQTCDNSIFGDDFIFADSDAEQDLIKKQLHKLY